MRNTLLLLALLSGLYSFAGGENHPVGARSTGVANASVTFFDLWSVHHNQAGLAGMDSLAVGVYYQNRFLTNELSLKGAAIAVPIGPGTFGVSFNNFGYSQYSENKFALAYAMKFGPNLRAGVQMDYLQTRIGEGYGSQGAVAAELGIQAQLIEDLWLGVHVFNLNRAKIGDYNNERTPTILRLGLSYTFSEKLLLAVETEKDIDLEASYKFGMEYQVVKVLALRGGVSTAPTTAYAGLGLSLDRFQLDIAAAFHQQLGASPEISLTYAFGK